MLNVIHALLRMNGNHVKRQASMNSKLIRKRDVQEEKKSKKMIRTENLINDKKQRQLIARPSPGRFLPLHAFELQ